MHAIALGNHFLGSDDPNVLSFKKEDHIIVTAKSDSNWWRGSVASDTSVSADFPRDLVHPLGGPMKSLESALFQVSVWIS